MLPLDAMIVSVLKQAILNHEPKWGTNVPQLSLVDSDRILL